jgi:phosphoribosyl 1,2-cyclic phosphodiesterase
MRVWILSSGSSGNAAIVESGSTRLLVDAGIGPRVAATRMRLLGGDLFPRSVAAILVTHQHGDHIAHLEPLARSLRAPIYLHSGITATRARGRYEVRAYRPGVPFEVGDLRVRAETIPHDASQVALQVSGGTVRFGLATDLGHVPPGLIDLLADCDEALVEANHDREMLADGPYPPQLKRRVGGDHGHLSNAQTAALAAALAGTRIHRLWLGHLSRVNNTPALALASVQRAAPTLDVRVLLHGEPRALDIVGPRAGVSGARQLALGFG